MRRAFLNIQSRVSTGGEEGLLSMAFAPDYKTSRRYYVFFIAHDHSIHIEEYRRSKPNPDRTAKGSGRLVLRQAHHESNHKGGQLQFGKDGMLYAGFGDGGSEGDPNRNGQKLSTLLAKLIRIDPLPSGGRSYGIPKSNPFVGRGGRDEIYAYGLRNPYRFSFDRRTGDLTIGDVGQDKYEEVDFVRNRRGKGHAPPGGYNFGWSAFEARHHYNSGSAPGHRAPVLERSHDAGFCSIIGGYVIRDRSLGKKLYGRYVYGDLCDPHLRLARLRPGKARGDHSLGPKVNNLVSFGEDGRGHVYAMSLSGKVYRLAR